MEDYVIEESLVTRKQVYKVTDGEKYYVARKGSKRQEKTLSQISHPQIPSVIGRGKISDGERVYSGDYLLLDYFDGFPLSQFRATAFDRAASWVRSVLRPLEHLALKGYVHGDVKPSNAVVTRESVNLIDFETAILIGEQKIMRADRIFTSDYAAPEIFNGFRALTSDVYSLGALIFDFFAPEGNERSYVNEDMIYEVAETFEDDPGDSRTEDFEKAGMLMPKDVSKLDGIGGEHFGTLLENMLEPSYKNRPLMQQVVLEFESF